MSDEHTHAAAAPRARRFSFDAATTSAILGTAILAAVAFIPFGAIPFVSTKVTIIALGALVALVLYVLARLIRGSTVIPPLALLGAIWLVPAAYLLSSLFSGAGLRASFFGTSFETDTLGFILMLATLATLTALAFRRAQSYRGFFAWSGLGLGFIALVQVLFVLASVIMPAKVSATTNLVGSFSDLGMLLGLGVIVSLLALRFLAPASRPRLMMLVGGGIALALLALVNSTAIWALVALTSFALFIESILRHRGGSVADDEDLDGVALILADSDGETAATASRSLAAPLAVLAVSLFFLVGGSTIGNALVNALNASVIDVRPSWASTFAVGSHTYASSPVFGSGPNTFGVDWLKFRDRALNDTIFWNIDFTSGIGFVPTSFVTTGVLGALAWLAFFGLFLFIGLRALLVRAPKEAYVRFAAIASFAGALYIFALAIFAVPGPIVLLAGFLLVGIFASTLRYSGQARERGIVFAKNPRVGFVLVFLLTLILLASILAAYVVVKRYIADVSYTAANQALAAGSLDAADAAVNRSILFSPTDRAYQLAAAVGIARMQQIAADTTLSASDAQQQFQTALSVAIQAALTATSLSPDNYQNWVMLGNVYETVVPLKIEGAYDNAKTAYQKAIALNPTNPTLPYILAQLEIAQGNAAAAEEQLTNAINLKHDYTQAIFLLSQLEVQEGKAKEALQAAEAAAYFAPKDPTVLFQVGILRSANGDNPGAIQALTAAVDANPQYANARFFLGVMYAIAGDNAKALEQLHAVAALSPDNATALAADIASLNAGKNPFPPSRLGALGIPQTVNEPQGTQATTPAR